MEKKVVRVILTGGGTGGHVFPAIALAQEFESRSDLKVDLLFVGTRRGMEARLIPEKGYPFKAIWISGFRRGFAPRDVLLNLMLPIKIPIGILQAFLTVIRFRPHLVVGTGGYVSGPVVLAAVFTGKKTAIQEQNSFPGWTTRFLSRWVRRVHLTFPDSARFFKDASKLRISGNPTRKGLGTISKVEACQQFGFDPEKPVLLLTGGSQGAHSINRALAAILEKLMNATDLQVLWQTGIPDHEELQTRFHHLANRVRIMKFIDNMETAYSTADLVLCRAGAMTIAELTLCGLPSVFVPYPFAAGDHQRYNARSMVEQGAAEMILNSELKERLEPVLLSLLNDSERLAAMRNSSLGLARPDAAKIIIDDLIDLLVTNSKQEEQKGA